jgi:hypothetical protein
MQQGDSDSGELARPTFGQSAEVQPRYQGADRRRVADRREGKDRREMIRYELDKDDRRQELDRREERRRFDFWGLLRRF